MFNVKSFEDKDIEVGDTVKLSAKVVSIKNNQLYLEGEGYLFAVGYDKILSLAKKSFDDWDNVMPDTKFKHNYETYTFICLDPKDNNIGIFQIEGSIRDYCGFDLSQETFILIKD